MLKISEQKVPGLVEEPSYYREDKELVIEKGNDGIEVNSEQLKKWHIRRYKK